MPIPEFVVDIRRKIGTDLMWLPAVTAVVRRSGGSGEELLLVRRADNDEWWPVTGILDPGEEPAAGAVRETMEETGVRVRVDRLASVGAGTDNLVTHANGDRAAYLDLTFSCTYLDGEARVGDDESVDVAWWPVDALPVMPAQLTARVEAALSGESPARFRS